MKILEEIEIEFEKEKEWITQDWIDKIEYLISEVKRLRGVIETFKNRHEREVNYYDDTEISRNYYEVECEQKLYKALE